jgi:hypothetical protein
MRHGVRRMTAVGATAGVGILATALCTSAASAAMPTPPPPIRTIPCGDTAALKARIVALNQFTGTTPPIVLAKNCVYTLTAPETTASETGADGLPQIKADIRIDGRGSSIVRTSPSRFRLIQIRPGGELTLNDLTLTSGVAGSGAGGAILDQGTLTLNHTTVNGNTASEGGGLYVAHGAKARVTGGTFVANRSTGRGGGIANSGSLAVEGATITANTSTSQGGGIDDNSEGTLTLTDTAVTRNLAGTGGGGIAIFGKGTVTISGGHIRGNTSQTGAGGVYLAGGSLSLANSAEIRDNAPTNCDQSPTSIPGCVH